MLCRTMQLLIWHMVTETLLYYIFSHKSIFFADKKVG